MSDLFSNPTLFLLVFRVGGAQLTKYIANLVGWALPTISIQFSLHTIKIAWAMPTLLVFFKLKGSDIFTVIFQGFSKVNISADQIKGVEFIYPFLVLEE